MQPSTLSMPATGRPGKRRSPAARLAAVDASAAVAGRLADGSTGRLGRALVPSLHATVRGQILSGHIAPGTPVLQATLARQLGVSRTPMREVFRLLQEEGLITASPDQRARVREIDAHELDSTYGARIVLEALGVSVTVRQATGADVRALRRSLSAMRRLAVGGLSEEWFPAHLEFHRASTQAVAPDLARHMSSLRERCELYIRLDRRDNPRATERADAEHEQLVDAFSVGDEGRATRVIAEHLARTALGILAERAPQWEPTAVRAALGLVVA